MFRIAVVLGLSLCACACGAVHERTDMPRPPYCVVGGNRPVGESMEGYGATYTPGMEKGPVPAVPNSHLVASSKVRGDCVAPPWWQPPAQ